GTTTEGALREALRRYMITARMVAVQDHAEGLAALEKGEADAYASDRTILIGLALRGPGAAKFTLSSQLFSYEVYGFMLRRGDAAGTARRADPARLRGAHRGGADRGAPGSCRRRARAGAVPGGLRGQEGSGAVRDPAGRIPGGAAVRPRPARQGAGRSDARPRRLDRRSCARPARSGQGRPRQGPSGRGPLPSARPGAGDP